MTINNDAELKIDEPSVRSFDSMNKQLESDFLGTCISGDAEEAKRILDAGLNVEHAEWAYYTASEIDNNHPEIVRLLIKYGLAPQYYKYQLPICTYDEIAYYYDILKWTNLSEEEYPDAGMTQALIESGAELNCVGPFYCNILKFAEESLGATPLDIALNHGRPHPKAAELLLQAGAKRCTELTLEEKIRFSDFHVAYKFDLGVIRNYLKEKESIGEEISLSLAHSALNHALMSEPKIMLPPHLPDFEKASFLLEYFPKLQGMALAIKSALKSYAKQPFAEDYFRELLKFLSQYDLFYNSLSFEKTTLDLLIQHGFEHLAGPIRAKGAMTLAELAAKGLAVQKTYPNGYQKWELLTAEEISGAAPPAEENKPAT